MAFLNFLEEHFRVFGHKPNTLQSKESQELPRRDRACTLNHL